MVVGQQARSGRALVDLGALLNQWSISASAPGRIDCGGTWDLKALALAAEYSRPATVNIALDVRTHVQLHPYTAGRILVHVDGLGVAEAPAATPSITGSLGLIFGVVAHFGVSGVHIELRSSIPPGSGLGGSGVSAVVVAAALWRTLELLGHLPPLSRVRLALLAQSIEDGMGFSFTGLQDQLAAVYGGVHKWVWQYSCYEQPFYAEELLPAAESAVVDEHMLVAYTGETRQSSLVTASYVHSFLKGQHRQSWDRIRHLVDTFAEAVRAQSWIEAATFLDEEASLREVILPTGVSPLAEELRAAAHACGCGAAFTGGNRGGSLWAIGPRASIVQLRSAWSDCLARASQGFLLTSRVSAAGVIVQQHERGLGRPALEMTEGGL